MVVRVARRARRPRAERESQILEAARWVFSNRGYAAGSLAEIAERIGVVEGTIYTYFASKRDLLLRVVADFYDALIREIESGLGSIRGAENRLRFLISRHLEVYIQDLGICRVVLSEIRPDPSLYGGSVRELNRRYTALALDVIQDGIHSGELRQDLVPHVLRDLIYGGIEHALWRFVHSGAEIEIESLGDQLCDVLLSGISARGSDAERIAERLERALSALERRAEP